MFGFVSLLSEGPLGFVARAAEDTLVYRIPAAVIRPVLERPAFVRFVTGVMDEGPPAGRAPRRAAGLLGGPPRGRADPGPRTGLPAGHQRPGGRQPMAEAGATCVVVDTGDGLGIVTDRDIRTRVVASGAGPETPLSEVMSAPAWTVSSDRTGTEALLEMLDQGVRHLPVLAPNRRLLGVVDDVDLMANERRAPFRLRGSIARAGAEERSPRQPRTSRHRDRPVRSRGGPHRDQPRDHEHPRCDHAATDRVHASEAGSSPVPYTWMATGSFGRFEPFPSSDVDSALAWEGPDDDLEIRRALARSPSTSSRAEACGFEPDTKGALASNPLFARSVEEWERAAKDLGRAARSRPRPALALRGRRELCGLGVDGDGRPPRKDVRARLPTAG